MCLINLPEEILFQIFEYCSIQSLCRLAQTCKKMNKIVNNEDLWRVKSKFVLGSNLYAKAMLDRSKPNLSMKERCEISNKWKVGKHKMQVIFKYPRCMPWLYLEQDALYCSYGRILIKYFRDENGHVICNKAKKLIPFENDISKFVLNGDEVISSGIDGTIGRWNKSSFLKLKSLPAHDKDVCSLDAKDDIILSGSKDCHLKIWQTTADNIILKKNIPIGIRVLSVALMPTNRFFVIGLPGINNIHPLQLFDLERAQFVNSFGSSYQKGAGILDIYPEFENIFLSCGYDTTVKLWDQRCPSNC